MKFNSLVQFEFFTTLILNQEVNKKYDGTKTDFSNLLGYNGKAPNYARKFLKELEINGYLVHITERNDVKVYMLNYQKCLEVFKQQRITKTIANILRNKNWFFPPYPELISEGELNKFLYESRIKK